MKITLSEIKKNLQGANSGENEAEKQINETQGRKKHSIRTATRKRIQKKKMRIGLGMPGTNLNIPTSES